MAAFKLIMAKRLLSAIFIIAIICWNTFAQTYYVSTSGSNANQGTIDKPWQTFKYAQSRLKAGDRLYLRGGTYFESSTVSITCQGTSEGPIAFQSYPGEHAVISGAEPCFMTATNSEWQVVDSNINLYRTKRSFFGKSKQNCPQAWLINEGISIIQYGSPIAESQYSGAANMDSTNYILNGMHPFYFGPGIMQRGSYIYVRLEPNPNDLTDSSGNPISPVPAQYNPNLLPMAISNLENLISFNTPAAYLHFKDITFAHALYPIESRAASAYGIEFDHCNFQSGGILLRYPSYNWYIHDCDFDGGVPEWVRWLDVKARDGENPKEAYPEFQSNCLSGSAMIGWVIERNVFHNAFDGMDLNSGSRDTIVRHNVFKYCTDDAMNIRKDINNCEIAYNLFWRVASGISCLSGSGEQAGPVYIHHNIIDNSHLLRGGRPNCADIRWRAYPWATLDPFGSHDCGDRKAWWRLYNNTIITRMDGPYSGATAGPMCVTGNPEKYIYNNIFYVKDSRTIFDEDRFSSGTHYDGNLIYQVNTNQTLLVNFGNGGNYMHLSDFRTANPKSNWEVNGFEIDPQFDFTKIDNPVYDANISSMWKRYSSPVAQIYTAGASYKGLKWPGTENASYRGAVRSKNDDSSKSNSLVDNKK